MAEFEVGQHVCIKGYGTSATVHTHAYVVDRLTKTMVIVGRDLRGTRHTRRFRLRDNGSVPYGDWGGSKISTTCQKEEKP